jgi:hypothetical protein
MLKELAVSARLDVLTILSLAAASFIFHPSIISVNMDQIWMEFCLWASREAVLYHQHSILNSSVVGFPMARNFNCAGFSTF